MSAPTPPEQLAIPSNSPANYLETESTPPRKNSWLLCLLAFVAAMIFFALGARSQMQTTKPDLIGPFAGGASTPDATPIVVHIAGEVAKPGVYKFSFEARVQDAIQKAGGAKNDADLNAINLAAFLEDGQKIEVPAKPIVAASNSNTAPTPSTPAFAPEAESPFSTAPETESVFAPLPELSSHEPETKPRNSEKRERKKTERSKNSKAKPKILPEVPRASTPRGEESQNADPKYFEKKPLNLNTATQEQLELLPGVGPSMAAKILAARKATGGFKSVDELDDIRGMGEKTMEKLRPLVTVN